MNFLITFFKFLDSFPIIGKYFFDLFIEGLAMVMLLDMSQFVDHHIIDGAIGFFHQVEGKADAVFTAATAIAGFGGGDLNRRGLDPHQRRIIGHPLR